MNVAAPSWRAPDGITSHIGAPAEVEVERGAKAMSPWWVTLIPQPDSDAFDQSAVWLAGGATGAPLSVTSSMRKDEGAERSLTARNCSRTARPPNSATS